MALTDDEKSLLEKLTAKANAPDKDDFEIEIYDTKAAKGARLPFSQGAKWLYDTFGIGDAPAAPAGQQGAGAAGGDQGAAGGDQGAKPITYFGGQRRGA
jgi:hypothetical protein